MFDKEAIQELSQAEAISAAKASIYDGLDPDCGLIGLPETFKIHDIEKMLPLRRRARGVMVTSVVEHFAKYVAEKRKDGTAVFVDKDAMKAIAVLNLGTVAAPGHADDTAVLAVEKTAPFLALEGLLGKSKSTGLTQRDAAEFLEDWIGHIECFDRDANLENKHAIDAVRRITIDSARKVESAEGQLNAERSLLESVAASSAGNPLPTEIRFFCEPYHGFLAREFVLRLGVRTGDATRPALSLTLRPVKWEQHTEEMAKELAAKVEAAIGTSAPVAVGSYTAKA